MNHLLAVEFGGSNFTLKLVMSLFRKVRAWVGNAGL